MIDPIIIFIALVAGLAVRQIGFPPLLGYLVAGFVIHSLGIETGQLIDQIASAGVTLLLFAIGLKLNPRDLASIQVWGVGTAAMAISIPVLAGAVTLLLVLLPGQWPLDQASLWTLAFALSFSSTVFAVKIFEESGESAALHAKVAIGILIIQDLAAVIFLALSAGKFPDWSALSLLLLIPLRPLVIRIFRLCGHGELLTLFGIAVAFGGYSLFEFFQIKGDLGALMLGMLLGGTNKTTELGKNLLTLKDLFLVGFFVGIGLKGLPDLNMLFVALALALVMLIKLPLFYGLLALTHLRARTSLLAALPLTNYSEFGLIVAAMVAGSGLISDQWVVTLAVAVALSFVIAVPFNTRSHQIYRQFRGRWPERQQRLAFEQPVKLDGASVLVMGMGRVGRGAYRYLREVYGDKVMGVEEAVNRLPNLANDGYRVVCGDATDRDFWDQVDLPNINLVMVSLTNHSENLSVCNLLESMNYSGNIAVIARFPDEQQELSARGWITFNLYAEAGHGFAEHVVQQLDGA